MSESAFWFHRIFYHDQICNPNRDYDLKYLKIYHFFQSKPNNYAYVTMKSQQKWYWPLVYFNNKISLLYSLCSCKFGS